MASSTVVSTVVSSTVQWIGSQLIQEARPLFNVEQEVQGLKDELEFMQQYLQDADARQDDKKINASVRQIRKLAYDAEDVIDTYILKVRQSNENWIKRSARVIYKFRLLYQVREKIQAIHTSLKRVNDNLNGYGLRRDTGLMPIRRERPASYRYDDIHGRFDVGLNKDLPKLLEVLTGEGKTHVHFLAIVGMGGSGKTTLARKLYNHSYIEEYFSCRAWVSVSQEWSTSDILSKILREVGNPEAIPANLGTGNLTVPELIDMIHNTLKKKSYLVVIDDVWTREALYDILRALPLGYVHGESKIIITTRNQDIVQFHNTYHYKPPPLSDEEGWELFRKIALSHSRHCSEASFENLGKEMLNKCDGLPLAIVALAGILNMKDSIAEWYQVNEAVRSRGMDNLSSQYGRVGDMLALSYDDLPYYLKPCFLYLSLFPEDFEVPVGMLTRMWIAEGLVCAPGDMLVEDAAMQHLEELSNRFLIQVVRINYKGVIKAVRLHDLLRDVGLRKARELNFLQIYAPVSEPCFRDKCASDIQPRRAALHSSNSFPTEISYLRSLVLLKSSNTPESGHNNTETLDLKIVPQSYKLLRLLTLRGIRTVNGSLPVEIGSLLHLRYLEIRGTNITKLPGSIGKLSCLLVLDYRDVVSEDSVPIIEIPNVLWKLVLLRHLFLPIDCQWNVEELMLSTLPNLQTLWGVKQEKAGHQWLSREIPKLSSTIKKLKIVVSSEDELQAAFRNQSVLSKGLQTFHCELQGGITLVNVEPLCHQRRLHKLILIGEVRMPLSLILPVNLIKLRLKDSVLKDEDPMIALGGLSHLKLLILSNAFVGTQLVCKHGSFPKLEELYLEDLVYFQMWKISDGAMPCLKKLKIRGCWCFKQFPQSLEFVTTLQQFVFSEMPISFIKDAAKYGWSPLKLGLPSNFGAIISRADSPFDISSINELYTVLSAGIFLDNKMQKYWVVERGGIYINCFMVYGSNIGPGMQMHMRSRQLMARNLSTTCYFGSDNEDATTQIGSPNALLRGKISSADSSLNGTQSQAYGSNFGSGMHMRTLSREHTECGFGSDGEDEIESATRIGSPNVLSRGKISSADSSFNGTQSQAYGSNFSPAMYMRTLSRQLTTRGFGSDNEDERESVTQMEGPNVLFHRKISSADSSFNGTQSQGYGSNFSPGMHMRTLSRQLTERGFGSDGEDEIESGTQIGSPNVLFRGKISSADSSFNGTQSQFGSGMHVHTLSRQLTTRAFGSDSKDEKESVTQMEGPNVRFHGKIGSANSSFNGTQSQGYGSNFGPGMHMRTMSRQLTTRGFGSDSDDEIWPVQIQIPNVTLHEKISSADLSLNVTYEIIWVVMLTDWCDLEGIYKVFENTTVHTEFSCRDHEPPVKQHSELGTEQLYKWVQVRGGEFETKPTISEEIKVSIHYQSHREHELTVKGFVIQPKP